MSSDTSPIPALPPAYGPPLLRDRWPRTATAAVTVLLMAGAGAGGWLAGHEHPRIVTRTQVRTVVHTRTVHVTRWRTRTTTATDPGLLTCAQELMGAWETDGQYADVGKLPPSAAQGYNPNVSACQAYAAVWNTPPDQTP